jgi:RHH-type rel operon transcriptional repressor/antitoxin RelB
MADSLKSLSETIDRSKGYIIKKALQAYLEDYSDYLIAQERLNDKNDKVVSCDEMRELIGLQD